MTASSRIIHVWFTGSSRTSFTPPEPAPQKKPRHQPPSSRLGLSDLLHDGRITEPQAIFQNRDWATGQRVVWDSNRPKMELSFFSSCQTTAFLANFPLMNPLCDWTTCRHGDLPQTSSRPVAKSSSPPHRKAPHDRTHSSIRRIPKNAVLRLHLSGLSRDGSLLLPEFLLQERPARENRGADARGGTLGAPEHRGSLVAGGNLHGNGTAAAGCGQGEPPGARGRLRGLPAGPEGSSVE